MSDSLRAVQKTPLFGIAADLAGLCRRCLTSYLRVPSQGQRVVSHGFGGVVGLQLSALLEDTTHGDRRSGSRWRDGFHSCRAKGLVTGKKEKAMQARKAD